MDHQLLNTVLNAFETAFATQWSPLLQEYMGRVLQFAIGLQIVLVSIDVSTQGGVSGWTIIWIKLLTGIARPMIIWWLFSNAVILANGVIAFGIDLGHQVSGLDPASITPSGVFNTGLHMMNIIQHAKSAAGWVEALIQDIEFFFVALTVVCLWGFSAIIYLYTLLQAAVLVYGGFLVIGFSPIGWVADLAINWAVAVLGCAIKIVAIMLVLATNIYLSNVWLAELASNASTMSTNMWHLIVAIFMSLVTFTAVWQIPNYFLHLIGISHHFSFGEALAATAMGGAVSSGISNVAAAGSAVLGAAGQPVSQTVQAMLMET